MACLRNLKKAFLGAKKSLRICSAGSKLYPALEGEAITIGFHSVSDKLSQDLDGIVPYDELAVSDEIEVTLAQLKRAKKRVDTQDIELSTDMIVVLSTRNDDPSAGAASIERLAQKLALHTIEDLKAESIAVRKLVKERGGQNARE